MSDFMRKHWNHIQYFPLQNGIKNRIYFTEIRAIGDSIDDLLLLQISSVVVWVTRDLHLSHNTLYLLSPRLCFFIVFKRDLFVYRDDSLTS